MVTVSPVFAEVGLIAVTLNPAETVKLSALLAIPPAVIITFPVIAPDGTVAMTSPSLQLVAVAAVPLNLRVLVPWLAPNPAPVIVTVAPIPPALGVKVVMPGPAVTLNAAPLLTSPDAVVTTTLPDVAPEGTGTVMLDDPQPEGVAGRPLNVTEPWLGPKFVPEIVTFMPVGPELGERLDITGLATTVNETPLLDAPPTVTTTLPLVAPLGTAATIALSLHEMALAVVPLNLTVLVPCVLPKLTPLIAIESPTAPEDGLNEEILTGGIIVNGSELL